MGDFLDDHIEEILKNEPSTGDIIKRDIAEDYKKLSMFRIKSVTILRHLVLGNIHLDLWQENNDAPKDIHSSVLIGVNGIGKSHLLRAISDIYCYLEALKNNLEEVKNVPRFKFQINYVFHGNIYEFANFGEIEPVGRYQEVYSHFYCKVNGETKTLNEMEMPVRVIASTMSVNDKFNTVSTERYRYKGIRNENSPGTTGTRTLIRKTVSSLLHSLDIKEGFRDEVKVLLDALGLEPRMEVTYTIRYKDVFLKADMTAEKLTDIFTNQKNYFEHRETDLWGTRNFEKIKNDPLKLETAAAFLRKAAETNIRLNPKKFVVNYHVLENNEIVRDREALEILSAIDLLSFPSLQVYKKEKPFEFSESSSGETHMLCQMLGIMSDIEHSSLVLIDEPENSSHPNWQINYIGWLKKIFKAYYDCHFVIATHSHFVLTDLNPVSSDIIALERTEDGLLHDIADGLNTFCWSVDDILYRVFHVRNTRNYVFESRMIELYKLLSERGDKGKLCELIKELSWYQLNAEDPLAKLLDTAKEYVKSN